MNDIASTIALTSAQPRDCQRKEHDLHRKCKILRDKTRPDVPINLAKPSNRRALTATFNEIGQSAGIGRIGGVGKPWGGPLNPSEGEQS